MDELEKRNEIYGEEISLENPIKQKWFSTEKGKEKNDKTS